MTKEEKVNELAYDVVGSLGRNGYLDNSITCKDATDRIANSIQEYADQQTKQLKEEVERLNHHKTILDRIDSLAKIHSNALEATIEKQRKEIKEFQRLSTLPSHAELSKQALNVLGGDDSKENIQRHNDYIAGGVWMLDESHKRLKQ